MAQPLRVLFTGLANHGHVYPLLPLATACREAGVAVAFALGEELLPLVRAQGFAGCRVGAAMEWGFREAVRRNPDLSADDETAVAPAATEILANRVLRELLPVLERTRPDLVVHEPYCLGAGFAAQLAGVPVVSHLQGRFLPARMHEVVTPYLRALWREHGATTPLPIWWEQPVLDFWPASLQPDPPAVVLTDRHPIRPVAWSDPAVGVPSWVTRPRRRPLVYLVFSTVFGLDEAVLHAVVRGVASLEVDVLAVVGPRNDPAGLRRLSSRVHVERFTNQATVLPRADVVVSHGGSGVFLGALAAGLPQLIVPYGADQYANADDLVRTGAGLRMLPDRVTAEDVADAVAALLGQSTYRQVAGEVSREIAAMPAPADVVPVLRELAAAGAIRSGSA